MSKDFEGAVIWQGDATYEQLRHRMIWNALKPDRRPEAIVRALNDHDVAAAITMARTRDLQVAVRSGGHSWVGSPLRDDTVLIDLSSRKAIEVDATNATATVEPAATSAELAAELARHGLAFPVGHCASVGVGGYLLSGGLGWNSGAWGPACLSVTAVDLVLSDGQLVHADDDSHPELMWAVRGAGPGFPAVVTRFHLALAPLPMAITTTTQLYALDDLDEVAPWATRVAAGLPPTVEMTVLLAEAGADLPADPARQVAVVTATAFADSADQAEADLRSVTRSPFLDRALAVRNPGPSPFDVLFEDFGGRWREGSRFASDNVWSNGNLTDVLLPMRDALDDAPSASSFGFAGMAPDPIDGVEEDLPDMAFSMYARTFAAMYAMWDDPTADNANLAWLPSAMTRFDGTATGHYVAEADLRAAPTRASGSFTPEAWARLERLRRDIDPDGVLVSYLSPDAAESTRP